MSRPNKKGRSDANAFIKLHRGVTRSAAWQQLSCEAKCLVLLVWERHNGSNNGCIPLSHREARSALRVGNDKTAKAFKQAESHGFLIPHSKGAFDWKLGAGQGRATEWEITTEPCDGKPAKGDYRKWSNDNTAPGAGAAGTRIRNRSEKKIASYVPDGTECRSRFDRFQRSNGS